eukprot:snap_masked-scaffold_33-processed-gene-3.15-mRNA-1 protein AED:1.00 eAED:1.00 QI:0/0/0/0/1/1/3/0/60
MSLHWESEFAFNIGFRKKNSILKVVSKSQGFICFTLNCCWKMIQERTVTTYKSYEIRQEL